MPEYEPEGYNDTVLSAADRAGAEGDRKLAEIAHRLQLCSQPDAADAESWNSDGSKPHLTGSESQAAYDFAVESGVWFRSPLELGQMGPSGDENDTIIGLHEIYKVNNLMHTSGSIVKLFEKMLLHNMVFPLTRYDFVGFTNYGFAQTAYPIFCQPYIKGAVNATFEEIEEFMTAIGFVADETRKGGWRKGELLVWDLLPKNVLKDRAGNIYVIDAEFGQVDTELD